MKNFLIILSIFAINVSVLQAQEMKKGMSLFNTGLGLLPGFGLNVSYDYGMFDELGPGILTVGGYVGYANWGKHTQPPQRYDYRVNAFAFSPRATYRYAINKQFEVYGTLMLGAIACSYSDHRQTGSDVFFALTAGCRYSFKSNFAVFGEMGFNEMALLTGGLCFIF